MKMDYDGQREHALREVFNGLRYIVHGGTPWRIMPTDLLREHGVQISMAAVSKPEPVLE